MSVMPFKRSKSIPWTVYTALLAAGLMVYYVSLATGKITVAGEIVLTASLLVVATLLWLVRDNSNVRLALLALAAFGGFRLIVWRIFFTLNFTSALNSLSSLALLFGELYAVFIFVLVSVQNTVLKRTPRAEKLAAGHKPLVDVLICTYNEPLDIVRRTLSGAINIDYENKRVYLCDDGRREEMVKLASDLGCHYITRPDNRFAKAGNINNALSQTEGDLVLFLDADHIPCTSILQSCVPYFRDAQVGIVQTSHRFMNAAPIQRNLRLENILPGEQEMFFQVSMVGKDYWNGAIFAGSSGLIRRSVLNLLEGMSRETVIEDCEFSVKMHAKGFKSVYLPEPESIALSPETLAAYLIQQNRWSRGQTQMLVLPTTSPFLCPGLTVAQRICYLSGNVHYLFGLPRLIYILIPAIFLLLGVSALKVSFGTYAIFAAPFLIVFTLSQNYLFKNFRHSFWSDVFETVLAPYVTNWTAATLIEPQAPKFHVTPKGIRRDHLTLDVRLIWPHALLLFICLLALSVGIVKIMMVPDPFGVLVNVVWDAYNAITLTCAILCGLERPQLQRGYRVSKKLPVVLARADEKTTWAATTENVSEYGARLTISQCNEQFVTGEELLVSFVTANGEQLTFKSEVVQAQQVNKDVSLALNFEQGADDAKRISKLIVLIYCSAETWSVWREPYDSLWRSLANVVTTPYRVISQASASGELAKLSIFVPKAFMDRYIKSEILPKQLKPFLIEVGQDELAELADRKADVSREAPP